MEDIGFYCVDNIPPSLLGAFYGVCAHAGEEHGRVAVVIDVRGGRDFETLSGEIERLGKQKCRILYLDASDEAVKELAKEGFDPRYGARPLRRAIQSKVEDAVAVEDDKLVVTK